MTVRRFVCCLVICLSTASSAAAAASPIRAIGLSVGKDGNLWFLRESYYNGGYIKTKVGKITPQGRISYPRQRWPKKLADSYLTGIVTSKQGSFWASGFNSDRQRSFVSSFPLNNKTRPYFLPRSRWAESLTPTANGGVWFIEKQPPMTSSAITLVRLSKKGKPLRVRLNQEVDNVFSLAIGPDKALWFSGDNYNEFLGGTTFIARVSPQGKVKVFNLTAASPGNLVAGPDGNIWFGADGEQGHGIGRLRLDGQSTVFTTGFNKTTMNIAENADLDSLTLGPDGYLWITEQVSKHLLRVSPEGEVTAFATGLPFVATTTSPGITLTNLTSGPDGNLWFLTKWYGGNDYNGFYRMTPTGQLTRFPLP